MEGMATVLWDSGWSSNGHTGTWEWVIDPAFVVAQVVPYYISGGGLHAMGIAGWRQRPNPRGGETVTDHSGNIFGWPGTEYIDHCSSVTFGVAVGGNKQQMKAALNLLFW